jgi:hypothetical protein
MRELFSSVDEEKSHRGDHQSFGRFCSREGHVVSDSDQNKTRRVRDLKKWKSVDVCVCIDSAFE